MPEPQIRFGGFAISNYPIIRPIIVCMIVRTSVFRPFFRNPASLLALVVVLVPLTDSQHPSLAPFHLSFAKIPSRQNSLCFLLDSY
jgi:hypothetical protein